MPSKRTKQVRTAPSSPFDEVKEGWHFVALLFLVLVAALVLLELLLVSYWLFAPRSSHLRLVAVEETAIDSEIGNKYQAANYQLSDQRKNLSQVYKDNLQALLIRYKATVSEQEWQNIRNQIAELKVPAELADYHLRLVSLFDLFLSSSGPQKQSYKQSLDNFISENWSRISYQSL